MSTETPSLDLYSLVCDVYEMVDFDLVFEIYILSLSPSHVRSDSVAKIGQIAQISDAVRGGLTVFSCKAGNDSFISVSVH